MKQVYVTVILVFCLQFGFGQIGFEEIMIDDNSNAIEQPYSLVSADINGDGNLDMISSSYLGEVSWFMNINNDFQLKTTILNYEGGSDRTCLSVKDIDGDGDSDLVVSSRNNATISWYENTDGLGSFGSQQTVSSAPNVKLLYTFDIDDDGDADIISASSSNGKLSWYENINGLGEFGSEQIISINSGNVTSIFFSDIDSDNDFDVLTSSSLDNSISWYENTNGLGLFGSQNIISSNTSAVSSVYAADINSDGFIDIVSASEFDDKLAWFEGLDGEGDFGDEIIITNEADGAISVCVIDVDSDNDMDILLATKNDSNILLLKNIDGNGIFSYPQIVSENLTNISHIGVSDIDDDGDLDVFSISSNKLSWNENLNNLENFSDEHLIGDAFIETFESEVYVEDINDDGFLDVVCEYYGSIYWYQNSNGEFLGEQNFIFQLGSTSTEYDFVFGDVDTDGDSDLIISHHNKIILLENIDGQGTFENESIIYTQQYHAATSVDLADLDNDGDLDVLASFNNGTTLSGGRNVSWFENLNAVGTFGPQQIIGASDNYDGFSFVLAFDINGDGYKDVVSCKENEILVSYNYEGEFLFFNGPVIEDLDNDCKNFEINDMDNDGDMDIILGDLNPIWLENNSNQPFFWAIHEISQEGNNVTRSITSGDFDNDGDIDVALLAGNPSNFGWYENIDTQGVFGVFQPITESFSNIALSSDFNNDGNLDIFVQGHEKFFWLKNNGFTANEINGSMQMDANSDGCSEEDSFLKNILISSSSNAEILATFTIDNGNYQLFPSEGEYITEVASTLPNYYISNPVSQVSNFINVGNTEIINFCIEPIGAVSDLNITIYPSQTDPRPGFNTTYQIVYNNIGTTQLSGSVSFEFDNSKLNLLNASETIESQTANTLTFDFNNLNPFETRTIDLEFNVFAPPTTNINDILVATATINPVSGDETEEDNIFTLEQTVIGSYDPNDITVLEGEEITIEEADKYLHYLIRFQNTGTASAINARVDHVLDPKLDWTTMQLESLSHTGRVEIMNETDVSFIFNNINLADSTNDEPNSHGYIAYKIKPKSDVEVGDIISGTADIFFDFNPAIITNTVSTEIVESLSVDEFNAQAIQVFPNPVKNKLEITASQIIDFLTVVDINGRILKEIKLSNLEYSLDVSSLTKGVYFLEIQNGDLKSTKKFIKN
ncbi:T9SS type A sorting domain-containing protein [Winogradskyella helgolandensis]|uniref:T9SS type A sorting domain-containing protein n=1 Tax=Winogradskyella helgolandensis TaxID=2697010 RepID=UPI0015BF96A9|nr:T9SS type A sorting domain-containing protein [Winogradskyella helgolandensis]